MSVQLLLQSQRYVQGLRDPQLSARCFGDFDQRNVLSRALTHFFQKFGSLAPQDANVAEQCQSIIIKRGISFSHCRC